MSDTPYCPRCGERRASDRGYTLAHFAHESFETVTNVDGTAWRTFRTLLASPGELTAAYMRGQRVLYMKPLQLFLIINVAYFVWVGFAGERVFSTPLAGHLQNTNYGELARRMVRDRVEEPGMTRDALNAAANVYGGRFNDAASVQAKTLIITMVPMFAGLVALVQVRRRRSALQHLVYATHVYAALLIFAIAQHYVVQWPLIGWARLTGAEFVETKGEIIVSAAMLGAVAAYNACAVRRAYGERWLVAVPKGIVLGYSMLLVLAVYRALLFFTVFWTT